MCEESFEAKLIRALHHPEPTTPVRAAMILGELGSQKAVEPLIELADSNTDPYAQEAAAVALGHIGDTRAVPCLARLSREGALWVRVAANRARKGLEGLLHADQR